MIMMEEFRRRKNLKNYWDQMTDQAKKAAYSHQNRDILPYDHSRESRSMFPEHEGTGAERFFEPGRDEVFDAEQFTLLFLDSDSVTNVTSLNRTNARRVLIFIGNGKGLISYGKGKAEEYETAFEDAFKKAR